MQPLKNVYSIADMAKKEVKPASQEKQGNLEEVLTHSEEFFVNNKKTIFGVLIAIIVIIAGGMFYNAKIAEPREVKASEALFPGEGYFMNGDYVTALEGDGADYIGFGQIAKEFRSTKAGNLANAYAGICCAQLDSFEVAAKYLSKFKGNDQMASPSILGALANCYASMDKLDKAVSTFLKAAKKADNNLLTPYYLFQAGLIYESMEKPEQALKLYNRIKIEYPASNEASDIENYIVRLTSK